MSEGKLKKGTGEGKKRVSSVSSERGSKSPLKRAQDQSPRKRGRPPKDEKVCVVHVRQSPVDFAGGLWHFKYQASRKSQFSIRWFKLLHVASSRPIGCQIPLASILLNLSVNLLQLLNGSVQILERALRPVS